MDGVRLRWGAVGGAASHPCIPLLPPCPRPFSGRRPPGSDRAWPAGPCPWSASGPDCSSLLQPCSPGAGNAGSLPPSAAQLLPLPSVGTGAAAVGQPLTPGPGLSSGAPGSPPTRTEGEASAWKGPTACIPKPLPRRAVWQLLGEERGRAGSQSPYLTLCPSLPSGRVKPPCHCKP